MAHEQAFEEQDEARLPSSHRQWQEVEQTEPDIAQMVEMHDVMTAVNQRLAEHRSQPLRRTIGDTMVGAATTLLLISLLDPSNSFSVAVPPILIAMWLYNRNLHRLDVATAALNLQEFDRRWIGPLFEALSWPNSRIRRIVRLKLLHLLPILTESDGRCLTQKQRIAIYGILDQSQDNELKAAILKALVHFGDAPAVSVVERQANANARTPGAYRVRREALICLPRLRERVHKQTEGLSTTASDLEFLPPGITQTVQTQEDVLPSATAIDQADSSLAKLEAEREKVARPAMRMGFLIANWCVITPFCLVQTVSSFVSHQALLGLAWAGATLGATQLYRVSLSTKRVAMMRKQAQQRDIKAVGLLAEALTWPEQDLQYEAASALIVLLPLLKANNASLLSASQRECLHQELTLQNARSQSDLIVAILQAFQQVGDTAAIPHVERLAAAKPRTPQEQKVVLEAQECLPYLRLCAGNNSASHSLLRASAMTETAATDNLLRPARENPETRPEQLLRPGNLD
ncbi:MAG: hypothetical protein JWL77_5998 [Chthonomonadaceae bacterium]|nr:hypothetical protein [Chthonomonadaceae bacterium]